MSPTSERPIPELSAGTVVLSSPADVPKVWTSAARGGNRTVSITRDFPNLTNDEREFYEQKLNSALNECGCALGAVFALGAIIALTAGVLFFGWPYHSWAANAAVMVGAFLISAAVGKFVGLYRAKRQIARIARVLQFQQGQTTDGIN